MSGRMRDVTGQRFGALVAVEPTAAREFNSVVWKFRCDCGVELTRSLRRFEPSRADEAERASCGCLNRGLASANAIDLSGCRFGRLTVMAAVDNIGQGLRWRCKCDCGAESMARTKDLRAGTTTSCGCAKGGKYAGKTRPFGWRGAAVAPGDKFGLLTVAYEACTEKGARHFWCDCACGGGSVVRGGLLTTGQTKSCGCLRGRPAAAKKAARRALAIEAAGETANSLKATVAERLAINAPLRLVRVVRADSNGEIRT